MRSYISPFFIALVTISSCRSNPLYCEDHVRHNCDLPPLNIDGQQGCISNDQCGVAAPVCDVSTNVCVQCTTDQSSECGGTTPACDDHNTCVQCTAAQPGACTGATPVCDVTTCVQCTTAQPVACTGATPVCDDSNKCVQCTAAQPSACTGATPLCNPDSNQCEKCTAHAQCLSSGVCLADGSCASLTDVAYVAPSPIGSDNATCEKTTPCVSPSKALQTRRPYIKFTGTTDEAVSINDQDVSLIGEANAQLTTTKNGLLLEIRGSSHVAIDQLTLTGASGPTGVGISVQAGSSGSLSISRSTISNNQGGGISIFGGTFAIVGNVFYSNGDDNTPVGGVSITASQNPANRLEFNTFSRNHAQDALGTAIQCVAGSFTARNNILSANGTLSNSEQVGGSCKHAYSIVRPGTLPPGTGNTASDPSFIDAAKGNLHIQPGSLARGAADPSSDLTGIASQDLDGDTRIPPADIGADQVK